MSDPAPRDAFIEASVWHGALDKAEAILASHPELRGSDIHIAAILGDDQGVRRFLALDAASATAKSGPLGWDALTHLCFSKFLRLDKSRSDSFVGAATALLDAGASANTGFFEPEHQPEPEWESALYGAAGVAHHAALTRLLLERGADPNDERSAVPRAGKLRQRRAEGPGGRRPPHRRQPLNDAGPESRLARLRRAQVPGGARRRSQSHEPVWRHGPAPGRAARQRR